MSARSRESLERELHSMGLRCSLETWDALAVAIPEPGERGFEDAAIRQRAIAAARNNGFSHLAVEIRVDGSAPMNRATLSGD